MFIKEKAPQAKNLGYFNLIIPLFKNTSPYCGRISNKGGILKSNTLDLSIESIMIGAQLDLSTGNSPYHR